MDALIAEVFGEVALVLVVCALFGAAAQRLGQPRVVGQIIAGVVMGPSLLGRLPGDLFPATTLPYLTVLAQIAVVIFMFSVGYELDLRSLRGRIRTTSLVAAAAFIVPLSLGSGAALAFGSHFAAQGANSRSFVLFMGVAMSVTALPVLAAIVRERGIAGSPAGLIATAAAGLMDVAAWLVLAAALVGSDRHPSRPWPATLLLISFFVMVMLLAVRPALRWAMNHHRSIATNPLPLALALALGSAGATASLGLHPVLGGFLAGLTMPAAATEIAAERLRSLDDLGGLLLPLFFVVTGLSTNISALNGKDLALLALFCAIAVAGKIGPAYAASRISGLASSEAATVAVLVNTRGLTELIALDVGRSAGLIDAHVFSVLVLMALLTTSATAPLLSLIEAPSRLSARTVRIPSQPQEDRPS